MTAVEVTAGDTLFEREFTIRRTDLVAYAHASGDHNPIHLDDEAARSAGLPGVIAHGMYTMGLAARAVAEWAGSPDRVTELTARFAKPVVVPAEGGASVTVVGVVRKVNDAGDIEVTMTVTCGTDKVLAPARVTVTAA
ncbi:MaoC dehydratase-like protein [Stackebrandtia endophytica]|uniref:MaoC dehydratase-like protein n=1 Tax=Stackebrandtia endophytica TaxID=1496996 RepID=A0A543AWX6_9ACTN|nr:MaoC/PaaZ C-terminal domain-containing protein [Stackebrandtia endophytica]TQL77073.1 MaoC dehydratase-like protein [Stackebrandtia endophytica]